MKTVQIPYGLFLDLAMYHLRGEDEYEDEICRGLEPGNSRHPKQGW